MKKIIAFSLALMCAAVLLAACGQAADQPTAAPESALSGSPEEILNAVLEAAGTVLAENDRLPPMVSGVAVDGANSQSKLGLSAEQFDQYITAASASQLMIGSTAYNMAVAECKDAAAAVEVKKLVAANYDSTQLICALPEKSAVVDSGKYILLASFKGPGVDAVVAAFTEQAGGVTGAVDEFYVN
jgi:hypothetical protein